jgi:MoaA/NifB/PqqE/SkfB family radical SAM enzyme
LGSLDAGIGEMLRLLGRRSKYNYIQIGISSRCTHSCAMCPRTVFGDRWTSANMTLETYERIAESFSNVRNVYLSGWGEPLLNPHFPEMVRLAKKAGCTAGFTTNGARLDDETIEQLIDDRVDLVSLSLAGATAPTHDSRRTSSRFNDVIGKLERLQELKKRRRSESPRVLLLFMMFKDNLGELPEAVRLAERVGAGGVVATNLDYVGHAVMDDLRAFTCQDPAEPPRSRVAEAMELAERLGVEFTAFPLGLGRVRLCSEDPLNNLYVSEDGEVSPCVYLNPPMPEVPRIFCGEETVVPRTSYGNINERSLPEIWKGDNYSFFRSQLKKLAEGESPLLPEECRTCYKAYGL